VGNLTDKVNAAQAYVDDFNTQRLGTGFYRGEDLFHDGVALVGHDGLDRTDVDGSVERVTDLCLQAFDGSTIVGPKRDIEKPGISNAPFDERVDQQVFLFGCLDAVGIPGFNGLQTLVEAGNRFKGWRELEIQTRS